MGYCFNYLRQGIMCLVDIMLEGEIKEGFGEGLEYECVDYDVLLKWVNEYLVLFWRGNLFDIVVL